jgi:hypothetical protein
MVISYRNSLFILTELTAAVSIVFIVFADIQLITNIVYDDALYYLKIGENILDGRGITFDGLVKTNGFQPLWMFVQLPLVLCRNFMTPEGLFRSVMIVQVIILTSASLLFYRIITAFYSERTLFLCGMSFLVTVYLPALNGMETPLLILLMLITIDSICSVAIKHNVIDQDFIKIGLLTGLSMATRLDMVFWGGMVIVGVILICRKLGLTWGLTIRSAILTVIGSSIIVIPILLYNIFQFGYIVPISGVLKASGHMSFDSVIRIVSGNKIFWFELGIILMFLIDRIFSFKQSRTLGYGIHEALLILLGTGALFHAWHTLFFMKWGILAWHFILYGVCCSFILAHYAEKRLGIPLTLYDKMMILLLVFSGVLHGSRFIRTISDTHDKNWRSVVHSAAVWAADHTEPGDQFAMKDAGYFAYFSRRDVVNLDGLVNDFHFQKILRDRSLNAYLQQRKVQFIVQHAFYDMDSVTLGNYSFIPMRYFSFQYQSESDAVVVSKSDEVYRSAPYWDGRFKTVLIIWKYRNEDHKKD